MTEIKDKKEQIEKIIKSNEWVLFKNRKDWMYVFPNEPFLRLVGKELHKQTKAEPVIISATENNYNLLFLSAGALQSASEVIFREILKNPGYVTSLIRDYKALYKDILAELKFLGSLSFDKNSISEISSTYDELTGSIARFNAITAPMTNMGDFADR